jgi:hypothetical protein
MRSVVLAPQAGQQIVESSITSAMAAGKHTPADADDRY